MTDPVETLRSGRYAVVKLLGEGGQASTFEAVDKQRGKLVAIKRFRVRGAKSWKEVELAEREAHVLASLDHPLVPRYVEHFEEGGDLYLVTEKIEGQSLAAFKKSGGRLSEAELLRFLRDASSALDYLHRRAPPVIHRDLKPSNIIRRPDGSFAFIDFGSVRDKLKPEGGSTVVGTFGYMAPEQFQGRAMPVSDVYAIGATAMAMITGREPEELPHKGLAIDVAAALAGQGTSPALIEALTLMLNPDPDARPARIAPLLLELYNKAKARASHPSWSGAEAQQSSKTSKKERRREERERRHAARRAERAKRWDELWGSSGERWSAEWQEEGERLRSQMEAEGERVRAQMERWQKRRRGPFLPWPILVIVTISLVLAQVAVTIALRVVVPIVFSLLSVVFGKGMRDAAKQVSRAGETATEAIARARDAINGNPIGPTPPAKLRVEQTREDDARVRVAEFEDEAEQELHAEEEEDRRVSARRRS